MSDEMNDGLSERASNPTTRVMEKADELRTHAELAAVFEGCRKFEANLRPGLDAGLARDVQRAMARAEKSREGNSPVVGESALADATTVLQMPAEKELTTNDYHIHRRPGEVMIVRWLAGDEVETFYERLQAHFDFALNGFRADERQANEWKQEPEITAYLEALDALDVKLADRYLRDIVKSHGIMALSTQTADEINIAFLCDFVMGVPIEELVGPRSAPPEEPSESDLAWFFKLFLLRGMVDGEERACFFTFMQKSDDSGWDDEE